MRADPTPCPALTVSDSELVSRCRAGETEAFGELFVRHGTTVRRLLTSVLGRRSDLDDLVQDSFMAAFRSLSSFRADAAFGTWLHRIAVNTALSALRRGRRAGPSVSPELVADTLADLRPDAAGKISGQELVRRLYALLDEMTPLRRTAFTLFEIEGRSLAEVAALTGVPVALAKSRVFFARREVMGKAAADPVLRELLAELRP